jgi:pimeloyl-ACP methyl ester carboxylesterase
VVYVSGTRDFDLHPTSEPWDMTSNFQALSGSAQADSEHAVRTAMEQAGIDARTPVILVGHSQGGLIASRIAASGDFAVTDLVVAGSPSHGVSVPERIRVTAFEHSDDLVPALSGPLTAATASTLFLRQKAPAGAQGVLPEHELQSYIATARLADASGDPLVAARRKALTVGAGAKGAVNQGSGEPRETCTSRDYEATRILPTSSWRG